MFSRLRTAAVTLLLVMGTSAWAAADFDRWAESFAANWMRLSPEFTTSSRYFSGAEQDALDGQLSRPAHRRMAQLELARAALPRLERWLAARGANALSPTQAQAASTLAWSLRNRIASEPFEDHGFAFNQLWGLQVRSINLFTQIHPLRRPVDLNNYLARLEQLPAIFDETVAQSRAAAARGLLPPRFIVERARVQFEAFLKPLPTDNLLLRDLAERSSAIEGLASTERERALARAQTLLSEQVLPAFRRALALLDELLPRSTDDAGLWRFADGASAYAQALASNTTTHLNAEEIHRIGLREVTRIEDEMDRLLQSLGRTEGSVTVRMATLSAERRLAAEPDPRPGILARYTQYMRDAERRAEPLFNLKPKAPVEVRRVPAITERTASAYYTTPAPDGSRPGIFWVPLVGPTFNTLGMRSLAIHEAVPGHHFQLALQQEQTDLPHWRRHRVFGGGSAHSEGWALYAERLAIDEGWYADDPHSLLGALGSQLFRARRLVVDTGLHAQRWTRQQAIDYGISVSEVERYVANPGQATAYMIGMLHILSLREEARARMGSRFSLPGFHDAVLKAGSVPLDVLSDIVRRWSATHKPPGTPG